MTTFLQNTDTINTIKIIKLLMFQYYSVSLRFAVTIKVVVVSSEEYLKILS